MGRGEGQYIIKENGEGEKDSIFNQGKWGGVKDRIYDQGKWNKYSSSVFDNEINQNIDKRYCTSNGHMQLLVK